MSARLEEIRVRYENPKQFALMADLRWLLDRVSDMEVSLRRIAEESADDRGFLDTIHHIAQEALGSEGRTA